MRTDFFRAKVTRTFLRPNTDGIAEIQELVAVNFGPRPAGFAGQYIGKLIGIIQQQIAQPVKHPGPLGHRSCLPNYLGLAAAVHGHRNIG